MIYLQLVNSSYTALLEHDLLKDNRHTCSNTNIWYTQVRKCWNRIQIQKQHHLENVIWKTMNLIEISVRENQRGVKNCQSKDTGNTGNTRYRTKMSHTDSTMFPQTLYPIISINSRNHDALLPTLWKKDYIVQVILNGYSHNCS